MPLVGMNKHTKQRLDITKVLEPRKIVAKGDLVCPLCLQPMTVVAGLIRIPHFRHLSACTSETPRHPESIKHLLGKAFVAVLVSENDPDAVVDFEVRVPECNRVADVLVSLDGGWRVAHEVQLASITTAELAERTKSYLGAGIDVTWWIGGKANTPANRNWIEDNFGDVRILEYGITEYGLPSGTT